MPTATWREMELCPVALKSERVEMERRDSRKIQDILRGGGKDAWLEAASFQVEILACF